MAEDRERETIRRFSDRYGLASGEVTRQIERNVIGGDWGANGYTTMAQADGLAEMLELGPDSLLLDLGAGRGWPGLYLASETGCRVVMADVPIEALAKAVARAADEGLSSRAVAVQATARHLPLAQRSFDAVLHTDVLC